MVEWNGCSDKLPNDNDSRFWKRWLAFRVTRSEYTRPAEVEAVLLAGPMLRGARACAKLTPAGNRSKCERTVRSQEVMVVVERRSAPWFPVAYDGVVEVCGGVARGTRTLFEGFVGFVIPVGGEMHIVVVIL